MVGDAVRISGGSRGVPRGLQLLPRLLDFLQQIHLRLPIFRGAFAD